MREHGTYLIEPAGKCFILRCNGSWNVETSKKMTQELTRLAEPVSSQPWGLLIDLTEWALGTPEIWMPITMFNRWANQNNLHNLAVVSSQNIQRVLIKRELLVSLPNVESKFFEQSTSAQRWLHDHGLPSVESSAGSTLTPNQ